MTIFSFLLETFYVLFFIMTFGSLIAFLFKRMGIIDIFWGIGIVSVAWFFYFKTPFTILKLTFSIMLTLWSFRLVLFLFFTRILKGFKDKRYSFIDKDYSFFSFFKVSRHFYFQLIFQYLICLGFIPIYLNNKFQLGLIQGVSIVLFLLFLFGESVSDFQLYLFKKNNKLGVCREGAWSVSRHPNYFFEFMVWVSFSLFSGNFSYYGISCISPITVFIIVRYMTGPYTERLSLKKHLSEFKKYQKDVPMFFPSFKLILRNFR